MGRKYKPDNIVSNPQEYVNIGYRNSNSTQTPPFVCVLFSSYLCHCTLITAPHLHVSVVSIFFSQQWANILTTKISAFAAGRSYIHSLQTATAVTRPYNSKCAPWVCDNRAFDGNAGPFGPPKPGVSTSAHCFINNWQRQTNQNNLLPTAKCWSSLTPVNH